MRAGRRQTLGETPISLHGRPLRLARMRCERGSVGVVLPASSRSTVKNAYARFVAGWNARGPKARTGAAKLASGLVVEIRR